MLEGDEKGYKQMFVDIAENAKGITKTIQVRFDNRRVVNRALLKVIQHPCSTVASKTSSTASRQTIRSWLPSMWST